MIVDQGLPASGGVLTLSETKETEAVNAAADARKIGQEQKGLEAAFPLATPPLPVSRRGEVSDHLHTRAGRLFCGGYSSAFAAVFVHCVRGVLFEAVAPRTFRALSAHPPRTQPNNRRCFNVLTGEVYAAQRAAHFFRANTRVRGMRGGLLSIG